MKQTELQLDLENAAVANGVAADSSRFSLADISDLTLYCYLDWAATTVLTFTLYTSPQDTPATGNTDLCQETSQTIGGGVAVASPFTVSYTLPAAADQAFTLAFANLNARTAMLRVVSTGGTTDTITVRGIAAAK